MASSNLQNEFTRKNQTVLQRPPCHRPKYRPRKKLKSAQQSMFNRSSAWLKPLLIVRNPNFRWRWYGQGPMQPFAIICRGLQVNTERGIITWCIWICMVHCGACLQAGIVDFSKVGCVFTSFNSPPVATLSFAPKGQGNKMDFVPTRKVASLLADHGVRIVVSNACGSANASEKGLDANMAKIFLESGISNVGAMQSEVMSGAATLFNTQFYPSFVEKGSSFSLAMREAHRELCKNPMRSARFGMEIPLRDWTVPVAYTSDVNSIIRVPPLPQLPTSPPTFSSLHCSPRLPPLALIPNSTLLAVGETCSPSRKIGRVQTFDHPWMAGGGWQNCPSTPPRSCVESNFCIRSKGYLRRLRTITTTSVCPRIHQKSEKELNVSQCPEPFSELHRSFVE